MNKTSKYRGVSAAGDKWRSRITVAGEEHFLGTFDTELDAAEAYDEAALNFLGDQAVTNFALEDRIEIDTLLELATEYEQQTQTADEGDHMYVNNFRNALKYAVLDQDNWQGALRALDVLLGDTTAADHLAELAEAEAAQNDCDDDCACPEAAQWYCGWETKPVTGNEW